MKPSVRAFSLIEILVTLAIIGLLAGLFITNTDRIFGQSQEAIARVFVKDSMKLPLMSYYRDMGGYPSTAEGLAALVTAPPNSGDRWRGPYIEGGKVPTDPYGEPYQYRFPATRNKGAYDLFSKGLDKTEGTPDDIGNW